jgi:hypothetical protein
MVADGLTKALTAQRHAIFIKQLNLVDINYLINQLMLFIAFIDFYIIFGTILMPNYAMLST